MEMNKEEITLASILMEDRDLKVSKEEELKGMSPHIKEIRIEPILKLSLELPLIPTMEER